MVRGGKIAIADHRVAPVSAETLLAVATEARVGGMLRGFIGMLIMHIGAAAEGLSCVSPRWNARRTWGAT